MAFVTVSDLSTETAVALGGTNRKTGKPNPTTITGYYIGSREVDSPKSKTGKASLHVFQTEKGNVGVWGKTDLDAKMQAAKIGSLTRVSFTGMQETKNNPMYKYKVEIDRDNAIEVTADTATAPEYDGGQNEGYEEAAPYEGIDGEEEEAPLPRASAPRVPARAPSADSQARVQALLAKRK